jgi:hypothetical protein
MKIWTEGMELAHKKRGQWFVDRIGKRVFREETSCPCSTCKNVGENGLIINDEMHASYLQDIEYMYNINGHKLTYRD